MAVDSALVGEPPNNEHDYWIIKGMFRTIGFNDADPNDGYTIAPAIPNTRSQGDEGRHIIAGMIVCIVVMVVATCTRLGVRFFRAGIRSGADDWMLIPAAVCLFQFVRRWMLSPG